MADSGTAVPNGNGNGNGHTREVIVRWLGMALTLSLVGVVGITISALWKPPQDWSVVDKGLSYLNTMVVALSGGLLALARPGGNGA